MKREQERLRISFESAAADGYEHFIMFLHYPPTSIGEMESCFTRMAEEYGAELVVYSHCHGEARYQDSFLGEVKMCIRDRLKVATINGAKTLGRPDLGSLEPGKAADLFMIDTAVLELTGALHDPKNIIARAGLTGPVWMTMINGNVVYRDGALTGVDEERLAAEGEALCSRVIREPSEAFRNLI